MTRYYDAKRQVRASGGARVDAVPDAERTAVYCRKSKKGDKKQITVNRQKRLALADCEKLGLSVSPDHIYVDNGASAWQRNRKREGWDALIAAARRGEIKHIMCYHPDRLMRQPHDLEELLSISDDRGIILYGRVNARDLQDSDDRYALRIEIAHACRSSDDTSRRLRDFKQERIDNGKYNGPRPYGYTGNGMKTMPKEAEIVREIFDRFTQGETPYRISVDLNSRGVVTARGKVWSETTVRHQLQCKHVAGILVHRGQEIGVGKWPAIVSRAEWDFVQELLAFRASAAQAKRTTRTPRTYILRGLAVCGKCGTSMVGSSGTTYRCSRASRQGDQKCTRSMRAEPLEEFVEAAAVALLTKLTVNPHSSRSSAAATAEREIAEDEEQLRELHDMWINKEIKAPEYRRDRRIIQKRIQQNEKKTVVTTKTTSAIADLIGPQAESEWEKLSGERKNTVLRYLFGAVIIGPGEKSGFSSAVDYSRVEIEENALA